MTEEKTGNHGGARIATRPDDLRRANPAPNLPFVPTDIQFEKVRRLSRSCTIDQIVEQMGISRATFFRHFHSAFQKGRAELNQILTESVVLKMALPVKEGETPLNPETQLRAALAWLNGPGGWRDRKLELSGPGGGPVAFATRDDIKAMLNELNDEQRAALGGTVEQLIGAFAPGNSTPSDN